MFHTGPLNVYTKLPVNADFHNYFQYEFVLFTHIIVCVSADVNHGNKLTSPQASIFL